jgi:hypothetical protein
MSGRPRIDCGRKVVKDKRWTGFHHRSGFFFADELSRTATCIGDDWRTTTRCVAV